MSMPPKARRAVCDTVRHLRDQKGGSDGTREPTRVFGRTSRRETVADSLDPRCP
jgi:hypothetical protein